MIHVIAGMSWVVRKRALRKMDDDATAAHFERLRSGGVEAVETSVLHLDALRDLKRVNRPRGGRRLSILKDRGELLPGRPRSIE